MKSRVLMAALVVTLLMGVRLYASDCEPCGETQKCDPCEPVCGTSCDLFGGLKKLVRGIGTIVEHSACDPVVACNPCDNASECNPCDEAACGDSCLPKFELGKRLKHFFASKHCGDDACNPCDEADKNVCNPCDETDAGCDNACKIKLPKISLKKFFAGFKAAHCGDDTCNPCDEADTCNPCDVADSCDTSCAKGYCIDLPRLQLKRLFDGLHSKKCNPCDAVECDPCDNVCK